MFLLFVRIFGFVWVHPFTRKKMEERIYVDSGLSAGMSQAKLNLGLPGAKKEI